MGLIILLAGISLPGLAQEDHQDGPQVSGPLYLLADGTLAPEPAGNEQACLSISSPGGASTDQATFSGSVADEHVRPLADSLTVLVALSGSNGQAQSGSGFTLEGELVLGNQTTITAPAREFGANSNPESTALTFDLAEANVSEVDGPLSLTLRLSGSAGQLGVPLGQDVQVVCNTQDTRMVSFPFEPAHAGEEHAGAVGGSEEAGHSHRGLAPGESVDTPLVLGVAGGAAAVTFGGGMMVLVGRRISERRIHLLLGVTAGLLLAIALVDLVPASFEIQDGAPWTLALGLLGLLSVRWFAGHGHDHGHGGDEAHLGSPSTSRASTEEGHEGHDHDPADTEHEEESFTHSGQLAIVAFAALAFHRIVDGLVLPAAFAAGTSTGLTAAGGVLIHQLPDGIAGASLFLAAGWGKPSVAKGVGALAVFTPIGAVAGLLLTGLSGVIGHLIALAAATFIFVALAELLPELQSEKYRWLVAGGFVLGYAIQYGIEFAVGHV